MIFFLTSLPLWLSGVMVVGLGTLLAMVPAMDRGTTGAGGAAKQALDAVYTAPLSSDARGNGIAVSEMLRQLELITQSRRARLVAAQGAVPNVIWLVLLGGAVVTIGFTFFFGAESLRAQVVMTALLALLIFSELLIIIAIDRPFTGAVKVEPKALAAVLADVESRADRGAGRVGPGQKQVPEIAAKIHRRETAIVTLLPWPARRFVLHRGPDPNAQKADQCRHDAASV